MSFQFSLGIDLGTSNSAVAITDFETGHATIVEITQILGPNKIGEMPTLPSALYIPHPRRVSRRRRESAMARGRRTAIIGHFAREHGALVPDRLVTSAKSWLSNPAHRSRASRSCRGTPTSTEKLSAFDCSRRYLEHLKEGFLYAEARARPRLGPLRRPYRPHRPGVLRRSRAQSHRRSRRSRRARQRRPARRAASGVLRLDRPGRQRIGAPRSAPATSSSSATSAAAPPTSA